MDPLKSGTQTTEFFIVMALAGVAFLSGLDINAGVLTYHANSGLLSDLFYAGMLYIGGRSGIKAASAIKNPTPTQGS